MRITRCVLEIDERFQLFSGNDPIFSIEDKDEPQCCEKTEIVIKDNGEKHLCNLCDYDKCDAFTSSLLDEDVVSITCKELEDTSSVTDACFDVNVGLMVSIHCASGRRLDITPLNISNGYYLHTFVIQIWNDLYKVDVSKEPIDMNLVSERLLEFASEL